jgi:hypothetical protein
MSWYTRGRRPERNAQAALIGGIQGFLKAVAEGRPRPWLYAATQATASAVAMDNHRLVDRAAANDRNARLGTAAADALNTLLDLPPRNQLPPGNPGTK